MPVAHAHRSLVFRLAAIVILTAASQLIAIGQNIPQTLISIDAENLSLKEVLDEISEQSGLSFAYNPNRIDENVVVTYTAQNSPLDQVLKEILTPLEIEFTFLETQILLKPQKKSSKPTNKVTLSGYVKDVENGEALIGTTIFIVEIGQGTITNSYGFYSLTIPQGSYNLQFSYIGYEPVNEAIQLNSAENLNVNLKGQPPILEGLVISSTDPILTDAIQLGRTDLRTKQVNERAALLGEHDVIKTLESVPGIKPHSDGSTFYYVRGGDRDQNLILIDDAPIYNPSHMLGLFSTVIPDAINDITVYKGEMPASLGGRLSSVLDIRTKKGNDQSLQIWWNTSIISSKLGVEGPFKKGKSSYLLSGRWSQIGWVPKLASDEVDEFFFNDFTGKINFQLGKKDRLFLSAYTGRDSYLGLNEGIEWTNSAATLRWTHLFHDRLFMKSTLSGSSYDYFLHTDRSSNTRWKSHISNFTLKSDFSYFIEPEHEVTFGAGLSAFNINPGNITSDVEIRPPIVSIRNSAELVLYGNVENRLSEKWGIKYGLRLTSWGNFGDSFEFEFDADRNVIDTLNFTSDDSYGEYFNAEPRLAVSHYINDESSIKASYSRNVQNLHLITNSISPFTSLEVWLPSNLNIKPQVSDQLGIGYYKEFPKNGLGLEVESFYKIMTNQIDYEAHAETLLNPLIERELRFGTGTSYGVEFILKKQQGRLRGWVGYSYSRAKRKFDEVNDGVEFNAFFDRPHEFNLVLGYDLNLKWNLGMNYTFFSGAPYSSPISFYQFNNEEIPIYGQKNNSRLPDYRRLDLSANLKLNKNPDSRFKHGLTFSIYNFLGRRNPFFINYNKTDAGESQFEVPTNLLEKTRMPSQTFMFQFVPSISYHFNWL
ncbi:MAG: TonB-dependent receptor [Cyclobacteriaceae bacterium]